MFRAIMETINIIFPSTIRHRSIKELFELAKNFHFFWSSGFGKWQLSDDIDPFSYIPDSPYISVGSMRVAFIYMRDTKVINKHEYLTLNLLLDGHLEHELSHDANEKLALYLELGEDLGRNWRNKNDALIMKEWWNDFIKIL